MAFSLDEAWRDTVGMLRADSSLLVPLAGVFFLLPLLLYAFVTPEFVPPQSQNQQVMAAALAAHLGKIIGPLLLLTAVFLLGTAAIYHLLLDRDRPTVGGAIASGLRSWPSLILLGLILAVVQFVALIVISILAAVLGFGPGAASLLLLPLLAFSLYVSARAAPAGPSIVAERLRGPVGFLPRALRLTKGQGWRIALFLAALSFAGVVVVYAVQFVLGSLLALAAGDTGRQITKILGAVLTSGFVAVATVAYAAVYRQLTRPAAAVSVPSSGI